eukprot:m.159608 g.159608  ORF g.159608 m.159608 type:complete len:184 (-) comp11814_c0_seq1:101-652(-)
MYTDWNFETESAGDTPIAIYFHTPWCTWCVNSVNAEFESVYEDYMQDPKVWPEAFRFAHVDCTDSPNLCHRLGQRQFPAIVAYYPKTKDYVPFMGNRDRDEIASFVALTPAKPRKSIAPRPNVLVIMLEYAETLMTTVELHEDEMINSTVLGLILGALLLTPALILYLFAYSALLARDKLKSE